MKEIEVETFLTSDFIYIPYLNKENIKLNSDGYVFKDDLISENDYSPVSGEAVGLTEIYGIGGVKKTVIVENDFKDSVRKNKISVRDLYDLKESDIKSIVNSYIKNNTFYLYINYNNKYDYKDTIILKDNINIILETLNIIDNTYNNIDIKIILNKKDIHSYQLLFTYLGTYPNIKVEFNKKIDNTLSIYEVIDIYNKFKNRNNRDFVYVTLIYDNNIRVVKVKKYSNLKDLLEHIKVMGTSFLINGTIKINNANFLLSELIETINIVN